MNKKKLIICITTIFILMICTIFIIYIVKNKDKQEEPITNITEKKTDNKKEETNKEKTIKEDNKSTIEKEKIKEEVKEETKQETKETKDNKQNTNTTNNKNTNSNNQQQQNNNSNNNNNSNTNTNTNPTPTPEPTPEPEPVITYYCPDGYSLEGTECTSIISADYICPTDTHDYSSEDIPRDTYCINLSEGYETEDSCPEGYGSLAIISLGAPTVNKCFPLHRKIYVCNDGYNLNGTNCIRTINAETR